ncbi:hypothetical protein [Krasilnikovia sp. M28-CT-15]|uniref:hypothetical protein n=1 Tax=Krasilnikovia sp. M28-CT-15 TaxID=3373540 RepID=UPI003875FC27
MVINLAKPTPTPKHSPTVHPEHADHAQSPAVAALTWLFTTTGGHWLLLGIVLGSLALFWPPARLVLGPIWRLLTGGLVFERPGPWDSTWLYRAPDRPEARPNFRGERFPRTRWGRMPGYQRMAVRWAAAGYLWAVVAYPTITLSATAAGFVALVVHRVVRVVQDWGLRRAAGLLAAGAAGLLGYGDRDPATWIAVPRLRWTLLPVAVAPRLLRTVRRLPRIGDRLEHVLGALAVPVLRVPLDADNATVRVKLDAELTNKAVIQEVADLARARLPEGPWEASHRHRELVIELTHPKRPPAQVWYDAAANQAYPVDAVPIGQSVGGQWEVLPLKALTPHCVVSASTGWGKTTVANVYVAHTAGNGARLLLNDPKRIGYLRAFGGLPNISIKTTVEGWVQHVDEFNREMQRRYEIIERHPEIADNPEDYFQPWCMLTDERGSFVSEIRSWWKENGEKGTVAPPLRQEKLNLWQARAAAMYLIDLAQQANLDVFLDSDGRDQRMARIAAGPQTRSSWMMLFPGIAKIRNLSKKGRAVLGIGPDDIKEVQLAQVSAEDARAFAAAGAAIAEKENKKREQRLAALMGTSVPGGSSVGLPGQTSRSVPGQRRDGQTADADAENGSAAPFSIISGEGDKSAGDGPAANLSVVPENSADEAMSMTDSADPLIVGLQNAANVLEMNLGAFEKGRKRRPIPGETRRGTQPAWTVRDLQEWRSQAPRAGRPAVGDE